MKSKSFLDPFVYTLAALVLAIGGIRPAAANVDRGLAAAADRLCEELSEVGNEQSRYFLGLPGYERYIRNDLWGGIAANANANDAFNRLYAQAVAGTDLQFILVSITAETAMLNALRRVERLRWLSEWMRGSWVNPRFVAAIGCLADQLESTADQLELAVADLHCALATPGIVVERIETSFGTIFVPREGPAFGCGFLPATVVRRN